VLEMDIKTVPEFLKTATKKSGTEFLLKLLNGEFRVNVRTKEIESLDVNTATESRYSVNPIDLDEDILTNDYEDNSANDMMEEQELAETLAKIVVGKEKC
jgi:hypothetical protein